MGSLPFKSVQTKQAFVCGERAISGTMVWDAYQNEVGLASSWHQSQTLIESYVPAESFFRDYLIIPQEDQKLDLQQLAKKKVAPVTVTSKSPKRKLPIKMASNKPIYSLLEKDGDVVENRNDEIAPKEDTKVPTDTLRISGYKLDAGIIAVLNVLLIALPGTVKAIALALPYSTTLQKIELYYTDISQESIHVLFAALHKMITRPPIALFSTPSLVAVPTHSVSYVNSLALDGCECLNSIITENPDIISFMGHLQVLSLRGNKLNNTTLSTILEQFSTSNSAAPSQCLLSYLDLWDNNIDDGGAVSIAHFLKANKSLTALSVGKNFIGDLGAEALATALGKYLIVIGISIDLIKNIYSLSKEEVLARKKLKAEAELQKRETDKRKKGLRKGIAKAKKDIAHEAGVYNYVLCDLLTLKQERVVVDPEEGMVDGNRTLVSLNIILNNLSSTGISVLQGVLIVNSVLTRCLLDTIK